MQKKSINQQTINRSFKTITQILLLNLSCNVFAQEIVPNYTNSLAQTPSSLLDSSVVIGNSTIRQRIVYTYDSRERLIQRSNRDFAMVQTNQSNYVYDNNDSIIQNQYAAGTSVPTLTALTVISRNSLKQIEFDTVSYSSSGQYTLNNSSSYTYDAAGFLTERVISNYSGIWNLQSRRSYQRNSSGQITSAVFEGRVNGNWQNSTQSINSYNNNNALTEEVFQGWSTTNNVWNNSSRTRYAYTGTHIDTITRFTWNNTWNYVNRYTYSPAGATDTVTIHSRSGSVWQPFRRYIRNWSGNQQLLSIEEQGYTSNWQNAWKYEYNYDASGNNTRNVLYGATGGANPWALLSEVFHYYSQSTLGIEEHNPIEFNCYPVPTSDQVYINSPLPIRNGSVYNASGRLVLQFEGEHFSLANQASGIYYLRTQTEQGFNISCKIIRQ